MKTFIVIVLAQLLCVVYSMDVLCQEVVVEKKSKIVTYNNNVITTRHLIIRIDSLSYTNNAGETVKISINDVKSLSIKEGTTFFYVMGICMANGLLLTLINPSLTLVGGLICGAIAGIIVAPFVQKKPKLVYYLNEWKDEKYKPLNWPTRNNNPVYQ